MSKKRPLIGILLDYQEKSSFSARAHYALRSTYFDAVWNAGGLPIAIPYIEKATKNFLSRCDGVVLPGGSYPFPDNLYQHATNPNQKKHPRFEFEFEFARHALNAELPTLGICAGMQIIAATKGATFYSDVSVELPSNIDHLNACPAEQPAHHVEITPNTLLRKVLGVERLKVNTAHKEAIRDNYSGLVISAHAPDGVIEGIEIAHHRFCVGVQWHPEFFATKGNPNFNLFTALIAAAQGTDP